MSRSVFRSSPILYVVVAGMLAQAPTAASEKRVIDHVNVVDVEAGRILSDQRVVVEGEKIAALGPSEAAAPTDAQTIDGRGKYVLPGLFDSHVHYVDPDNFGPLCIVHGVTFVRDMGGATEQILPLRDRLNRGDELGPEMIATGAIIDGDPPVWPFSEPCDTPEEGRAAVRKLAEAGVNQIKVYSKLSKETYLAALEEARRVKLKAVGHIPLSAKLEDAVAGGQATIEHLEGFDVLIAEAAGETLPEVRDFRQGFSRWELLPKADKVKLTGFYARMKTAGTAVCPTMVVMRGIGNVGEDADPWLDYVSGFMRAFWDRDMYKRMAPGARAVVPMMQSVVKDLHAAGVTLLCGTDLANPNVIAGHSVHEELALLQAAGLPAADVLRTATINPARLFGVSDRLGTISKGKTASLVLVNANPLDDVANARQIEGVFLRGEYFDRKELDGLLAEVKDRCSGETETTAGRSAPVELTLPGEVLHKGRYRSKFMEMDAGTEEFIITKTADGFSIKAHSKPSGGPQRPSVGTFHLDAGRRVRRGVWETTSGPTLKVEYVFDEKSVTGKVLEGESGSEQKLDLPENWTFGGPFNALDFASPSVIELAVGDKKVYNAIGFGFPGWQMVVVESTIERQEDRPLKTSGGELAARYYTGATTLPMGEFLSETWTTADGLVLKAVLKMPFGTVSVELE